MSSKKDSRALRFYSDVLGLEHLHYGLWQAGEETTLANLKTAQARYQQAIIDLLPPPPARILDVGCGTGELSKALQAAGYQLEGLSPDKNHVDSYAEKVGAPFHHCLFEEFEPQRRYDVIIMSESCQYIPLDRLFAGLNDTMSDTAIWIVVDYFVKDGIGGVLAKSGHSYTAFQRAVADSDLTLDYDRDITEAVLPTLDFASDLISRGELALFMLKQRIDQRSYILAKLVKFILWLARKEIKKLDDNRILIDSEAFQRAKTYRLMRFLRS